MSDADHLQDGAINVYKRHRPHCILIQHYHAAGQRVPWPSSVTALYQRSPAGCPPNLALSRQSQLRGENGDLGTFTCFVGTSQPIRFSRSILAHSCASILYDGPAINRCLFQNLSSPRLFTDVTSCVHFTDCRERNIDFLVNIGYFTRGCRIWVGWVVCLLKLFMSLHVIGAKDDLRR